MTDPPYTASITSVAGSRASNESDNDPRALKRVWIAFSSQLGLIGPLFWWKDAWLYVPKGWLVNAPETSPDQHRWLHLGALVTPISRIKLWNSSVLIPSRIKALLGTIKWQQTLVIRVGTRSKPSKSIWAALFSKFRPLSGEYLWNRWANFGSVNCVRNVFLRAVR